MKVKIKTTAGREYTKDHFNETLVSLRGQWVEIDTGHLFNNQYNLKDYDLRIFDKDIEAVKDDERKNRIGCGYCGKQFNSPEELEAHYLEEEAKENQCTGCWYYRKYIKDTQRTKESSVNENGEEIETNTTIYIWDRKCKYEHGCTHNEHRKHKITVFTPENTYFLKYPNGYAAYFNSLSLADQWKECGFTYENNVAYMGAFVGSYALSLHYNESGLDKIRLINSRKEFIIPAADIFKSGCCMSATIYNLQKTILKDFPKSAAGELSKVLDHIKDECRYTDYKSKLYKINSPV